MITKPLIHSILAAACALALPAAALADDHHMDFHGGNNNFHGSPRGFHGGSNDWHGNHGDYRGRYSYRYGGHDRYGYGPVGGFGFFYGGPAYYYDAAPVYDEGGTVYSDEAVARDVQYTLRHRGYYHGEIDGDIGPASRAAIRAYQVDRGLPVTGAIDSPLLHSLGLA